MSGRNDPLRDRRAIRNIGYDTVAMLRALRRIGFQRGMTVLDIGGGGGGSLVPFMQVGAAAKNLTCVDSNPASGTEIALRFPGVTFVNCDAAKMPFPDRHFDVVTSSGVLYAFTDAEQAKRVTAEMRRVCRGHLLISDWSVRLPFVQKGRIAITRAWCKRMFRATVRASYIGSPHAIERAIPHPRALWRLIGRRVYVMRA